MNYIIQTSVLIKTLRDSHGSSYMKTHRKKVVYNRVEALHS